MSVNPRCLSAGTTVAEAARVIWTAGWLPLPVIDEDGRVLAVVSPNDLVRAVAQRRDVDRTPAVEFASAELVTVSPDDSLEQAAAIMRSSGQVVIVVSENSHLLGALTATDIEGHQLIESELGAAAADVIVDVSPHDLMYAGSWGAYAYAGVTAVRCIREVLSKLGRPAPASILDLPCGHGRELRFLKAAFPGVRLGVCDIDSDGVEFCARVFGAEPTLSHEDPSRVRLDRQYELAWCGSLFTHLAADRWPGFLELFARALEPGGLFLFTTNGYLDDTLLRDFGLEADQARQLKQDFTQDGFGYTEVADGSWGLTMARPWWVKAQVEQSPFELVSFERWAWRPPTPAQDVVVCTVAAP